MVGKAFKGKLCTSGSVSSTFTEDAGYIILTDCVAPFNYTTMQNTLKADLVSQFDVTNSNTAIYTATNKTVVTIISYNKPISGWNCTVLKFAYGFGNNSAEA
jgi:hypothetical protein